MTPNPGSALEITKRATDLIGAEVRGIDLAASMSEDELTMLHDAWMEHLLLIFPAQQISDDAHIAFGRRFGELEIHPSLAHRASGHKEIYRVSNVDEQGNIIPQRETSWQYLKQSWRWHTDSSFREVPSMGSILRGIEITNAGGNTLFANMYAAYDALDEDTKAHIDGLWVIHDHDYILSLSPELSQRQDKGNYDELPAGQASARADPSGHAQEVPIAVTTHHGQHRRHGTGCGPFTARQPDRPCHG